MAEIFYIDQLVETSLIKDHLDSITQVIGIPIYILKNDGTYILGEQSYYRQICDRFIKNKSKKCEQCPLREFDTIASVISNDSDGLVVYVCLPMVEAFGSSIIVDKKPVAIILAEKKKSSELNIAQIQECAHEFDLDPKTTNTFIESILATPVLPEEKTKSAQKLISVTANVISQLASKELSLRRSIEQMKIINEIAVAISRFKDIDLIIQFVVDRVVDLTKASNGNLFLWDDSKRALVTYKKKDISYYEIPEGKGIVNRALDKREIQRINNIKKDPDYEETLPDMQSELAVPLIAENVPIGVLDILSDQLGHFTDEHEQILVMLSKYVTASILSTFVTQVATSIKNTHLIDELKKSTTSKDELIRNLAHELKTPLTHIITFLEHLVNRSTSISDKERKFARLAHQEMWRYVRLVDKILTFSRILGKKLVLSKELVNLSDILRTSIDFCTPIAKIKGIELQFQEDVKDTGIVADKDSLIQILVNLLDNAIKYTPNGGIVQVSLEEQSSSYRIRFSDNGIGISETSLHHTFEPYHSGDDDKPGQRGGLGIGLYIVKQLVEEHHGTIAVESKLGEGTTFTLDLPKKETN
jgi:signal transduction histidine kinase